MIRSFLFDLGNVLLHFSHEKMCEQIGALVGKSAAEIRAVMFGSHLLRELETGRATEEEFQSYLETTLDVTFDLEELRRAASDIFTLNEPMAGLLEQLKEQGCRLVLLSNTSITHYNWVREQFDILSYFDAEVLSFQVGAVKPSLEIFDTAIDAAQCEPAECFYTDDIPEYVDTAKKLGIDGEVFKDHSSLVERLPRRGITVTQ